LFRSSFIQKIINVKQIVEEIGDFYVSSLSKNFLKNQTWFQIRTIAFVDEELGDFSQLVKRYFAQWNTKSNNRFAQSQETLRNGACKKILCLAIFYSISLPSSS